MGFWQMTHCCAGASLQYWMVNQLKAGKLNADRCMKLAFQAPRYIVSCMLTPMQARAAEQDAGTEAEGPAPAQATAEPQLQLSTRLHPQDPRLENLATAADYPHRFNTRPDGNPDQVGGISGLAAAAVQGLQSLGALHSGLSGLCKDTRVCHLQCRQCFVAQHR